MMHSAWKRKRTRTAESVFPKLKVPANRKARAALILERKRKAFEAGNLGALGDVVIFCCESGILLPAWTEGPLVRACKAALHHTPEGRRWLQQRGSDNIHLERYWAVEEYRNLGVQWEDAYAEAAYALEGKRGAGSEHAVQRSYKLVKREIKKNPSRFDLSLFLLAKVG
jgi:hypothetical protein